MFAPTERYNLADILRPPPRYRLDAAVGTTYSLDFVSLTAMMLAFVDAEPEGDAGGNEVDILRGITRLSERVRVYANRGCIRAYPNAATNKVCGLFDGMIREMAYTVGCFHPKVWVARYEPRRVMGSAQLQTSSG